MPETPRRQVIAVAPMPPEKCAYALARYSRSADSIAESLAWVRTHDSSKFLESFYFQYGHASIADLGHVVLCFEGISELAAAEVEDEPLWDGQAKSSRYQNFGGAGFIVPLELSGADADLCRETGKHMLETYRRVHEAAFAHLSERHTRPDTLKEDAYRRNIAARAFDVARYLLFWGIPTNVGQVTSIRTLEKQIQRLKSSPYAEVRAIGNEIAAACAAEPACKWSPDQAAEAMAPTLAKYVQADAHLAAARSDLQQWAAGNLPPYAGPAPPAVDLFKPSNTPADIVATLLYPVCAWPFRALYEWAANASPAVRAEVIDAATGSRTGGEELLREFRGNLYAFDMVMDIGAYRDFHRHRRCQQYRQAYSGKLGYDTPPAIAAAGVENEYRAAMDGAFQALAKLPPPASDYLLPFGARSRFLFKMDFAEAEYIARVRSGVKGHFSYRTVAWEMKCALEKLEPELARLLQATPPWIEDPLKR